MFFFLILNSILTVFIQKIIFSAYFFKNSSFVTHFDEILKQNMANISKMVIILTEVNRLKNVPNDTSYPPFSFFQPSTKDPV